MGTVSEINEPPAMELVDEATESDLPLLFLLLGESFEASTRAVSLGISNSPTVPWDIKACNTLILLPRDVDVIF